MAEAFAIIGVVQAALSLVSYGGKIAKRMDEFNHNVKGLPESFVKIHDRLPLLLNIVEDLQKEASLSKLNANTVPLLVPVLEGLRKEIVSFDETLLKALPSPHASNREKIVKAIRGVGIQKKIDEFRSRIQDYLNTLAAFHQTHHAESLRELMAMVEGRLERPVEPPPYGALVPSVPKPKLNPVWMVKYDLEEDFVGRHGIMSTIEKQLTEGNHRAALAGIGGVGKSRIAIQYSYRHHQLHPDSHIFWVHGGSRSRFETDYRKIARLLDLPGREDPDVEILRLVTEWLSDEANGPWLMILDNADDRDLWLGPPKNTAQTRSAFMPLIQHLPRSIARGLLVSTRDRQLGYQLLERKQQPLPISRLEPKDAQSLLSAKLSDQQLNPEDIEKLAGELEYLPLTITQAAAYLEQTEISASEYLEIFRAGQSDIPNLLEESIYDPSRDHESSNSVFQTWRLSFEQLTMQSPKAAAMLSLMAVLDRQAIPSELVQAPGGNTLDQKAAIAKLKAFSLIQEESSSSKYSLHRLVQLSTQRWLADHDKLSHWQKTAISAVARECPEDVTFDQWALIQDLSSHVQIVLAHNFCEPTPLVDRARILHCLGHYTMEQGQTSAALQMLLESHQLREKQLGSEDELTLGTLGLIGLAHSKLSHLKSARQVLQLFHDSANRVLGPRHRLTLKGKSRLAVCYDKEGKLREGKELSLQALQLAQEEFGPDSEDTVRVLTNLVYCCNRLGQWREAEDVGLRVLKQRMEQRGPDHPDTLTIMGSLAWTYRAQSRFQEAEVLDRKALSRRLEILGPDHPKTQLAMGNLAESCGLVGDWKRARELQRGVVEAKQRTFGAQHGNTRRAKKYLRLLEAVLRDERNELAAVQWLTKGGGRGWTGISRVGGNHNYSTNPISPSNHDSVMQSRNGSTASMPHFSSNEWTIPFTSLTAQRHSPTPTLSNTDLQAARNEVTRTLQAMREAQAQSARLNRDLAQHIQDFARGNSTVSSAEFDFLRYDHKDHVYARLRKAQTEHERAKEHVRSLEMIGNDETEGAKRDG
ncbi:MAG: hypothetical protein ASARMPRED_009324 [Alectoria sarmentosa]|nr:MAG: hypothetical protein ASARMPRED_009324 [Alectoria sarmentosa]